MHIVAHHINGTSTNRSGVTEQEALQVYNAQNLREAIYVAVGDDYGPPITSIDVQTKDGRKRTIRLS